MVSMSKFVIKKYIDRRRGFDKILQIHRRHGFGEIIQKIKNTVGDMVSAKVLREVLMQLNKSKMTKFDSRLRQQCSKLYNIVVGVLSLAPCYVRKKQVRDKGVPSSYHHGKAVSSLVDDCQTMHPPPANVRRLEQKKFYICSDVTHTHPAYSEV